MIIASCISFCVACVAMGAVYVLTNRKGGWLSTLTGSLTLFLLLAFSLVSANLKSTINAMTLCIPIAIAMFMVSQNLNDANSDSTAKRMAGLVCSMLAYLTIALSELSLAEFNLLALISGFFVGLGFGFVAWGIKKYTKWYEIVIEILSFAFVGMILGLGVYSAMKATHAVSALMILLGGAVLLVHKMLNLFNKNKVIKIIIDVMYILGLLLVVSSICFY